MGKLKFIVPILLLAVLVLVGAGCGEKEAGEGVVSPGGEGEEVESLTDVLGKATGISSLKYDAVVTAPGEAAVTTKMWWKGEKMRMEATIEGRSMVYLLNMAEQLAYVYFPADNTAMAIGLGEAQEAGGESPTEQSGSIMEYNPVTLGTEVLDGKTCLVVEYTTETTATKAWVWTRYGLLIRVESTTDEGTTVFELKNIDFGAIPDSTFELPAGVQMIEIPFLGL